MIAQSDGFMSFAGEVVIQPRNIFRLSGNLSFQKMHCSYWGSLFHPIHLDILLLARQTLKEEDGLVFVPFISTLILFVVSLESRAMAIYMPKQETTDFLLGLSGLLQANLKK